MYIYCTRPSKSAFRLRKALGVDKVYAGEDRIINWGHTHVILPRNILREMNPMFNTPYAVAATVDKLSFFNLCAGQHITPEYTTIPDVARAWCASGDKVVCRTKLRASAGHGIVIARRPEEVVDARLYTKYTPKRDEYRVHIFNREVIDIAAKRGKEGVNKNWEIRTHDNGFIYARKNLNVPAQVIEQAMRAMFCTELDFGGVDVIWNADQQLAYVLEINTAPGLEGETVEHYAKAIKELA